MGARFPQPPQSKMKCVICKNGETQARKVSVTLSRPAGVTVVFKDVPAQVCENCGEQYVSSEVTAHLLAQASEAARAGVEVEIRSYAA